MFRGDWGQLYAGGLEELIEFISGCHSTGTFDNDGCLKCVRHRYSALGGLTTIGVTPYFGPPTVQRTRTTSLRG